MILKLKLVGSDLPTQTCMWHLLIWSLHSFDTTTTLPLTKHTNHWISIWNAVGCDNYKDLWGIQSKMVKVFLSLLSCYPFICIIIQISIYAKAHKFRQHSSLLYNTKLIFFGNVNIPQNYLLWWRWSIRNLIFDHQKRQLKSEDPFLQSMANLQACLQGQNTYAET